MASLKHFFRYFNEGRNSILTGDNRFQEDAPLNNEILRYSSAVLVPEKKIEKYLPHNKIIKATFHEDLSQSEGLTTPDANFETERTVQVYNITDGSVKLTTPDFTNNGSAVQQPLVTKKPNEKPPVKLENKENLQKNNNTSANNTTYFRPKRRRNNRFLNNFAQSTVFKNIDRRNDANFKLTEKSELSMADRLKELMKKSVFVQPTFLSGFLPLSKPSPSLEQFSGKTVKNSNFASLGQTEVETNVEETPSSAWSGLVTTSPPAQTNTPPNNINATNSQQVQDLRKNLGNEDDQKQKKENLMMLILKELRERRSEKKDIKPKRKMLPRKEKKYNDFLRPVQSIKDRLFGGLFRNLRKESRPLEKRPPAFKHEPSRLPQTFIRQFSRQSVKESVPPSSQESYKQFLNKIYKDEEKQKDYVESSIEKPDKE